MGRRSRRERTGKSGLMSRPVRSGMMEDSHAHTLECLEHKKTFRRRKSEQVPIRLAKLRTAQSDR